MVTGSAACGTGTATTTTAAASRQPSAAPPACSTLCTVAFTVSFSLAPRLTGRAEVTEHREHPPVADVARVQPELGENRIDVLADRAIGDHQGRADLRVGAALGHQRQHVPFPLAQVLERVPAAADQQLRH